VIECHCGKCARLATKNTKLKERVAELEAMVQEFYTPTDRTPKDPTGPLFLLFDSWEEYKEKHKENEE